ncbi:hypothetical protein ACEPAF_9856 [Sanghuangporus sanghuang]
MANLGSANEGVTELPKYALAPFHDQRGGIILQSSDRVNFRVLKSILGLASPVFDNMFSFPQPAVKDEKPDEIAVVYLSESSDTLDTILRLCYPIAQPQLSQRDISLIVNVLQAARKYEMNVVVDSARDAFKVRARSSESEAIKGYALACSLGWEIEPRIAATACLQWAALGSKPPQLAAMSGLDYYNLLDFHRRAAAAVKVLLWESKFYSAISPELIPSTRCQSCKGPDWIRQSKWALAGALEKTPLDFEKVSLSTVWYSLASACSDSNQALHLTTSYDSAILLRPPQLSRKDITLIGDILRAALNYEIECVSNQLERLSGLDEEARIAAAACLKWPAFKANRHQLALMSGLDVSNLLEFRRQATTAIMSLFEPHQHNVLRDVYAKIYRGWCHHRCLDGRSQFFSDFKYIVENVWWTEAKSAWGDTLEVAPLDTEKLSISTIIPALTNACIECKDKFLARWDRSRASIIRVVHEEVAKHLLQGHAPTAPCLKAIHTIDHKDRSSMHYTCSPPVKPLKARFLKTIFTPSSHQSFTFDLLPDLNRIMSPDPIVNGPSWSLVPNTPVNSVSPPLGSPLRSTSPLIVSPIEPASPPFDGTRFDVILKSVDHVNFHVLKSVLELASPFFADMFSLPQPPAEDENPGEIPVISLAETSTTLDALLRFCYPVKRPRLDQQDVLMIAEVLRAAVKYDIDAAIEATKEAFEKRVNVSGTEAIKGYAMACSMHLYEEARMAAMASLRWPSLDIRIPQLALITGLDHYDFLDFRKRAGIAVDALIRQDGFFRDTCPELLDPGCCYRYRKDQWQSESISGLVEALGEAPLDSKKVSLSTVSTALFQACSKCRDKMIVHWDDARSKIIRAICATVAKVELKQQHLTMLSNLIIRNLLDMRERTADETA